MDFSLVNRTKQINISELDLFNNTNMSTDITERIRQRMSELRLKSIDIVNTVKVSKSTVSMWINGTSKPNGQNLLNLAALLEVDPSWLVSGKSETRKIESNATMLGGFDTWDEHTDLGDDEIELPFFIDVQLAAGSGMSDMFERRGPKLRFAKSTLRKAGVVPENAACVKVAGNSMEPVLPNGSVVGVSTAETAVVDGDMYAINHDGLLRIKLLYRLPGGGIRLRSYNSTEYPDETYTVEQAEVIRIIGRIFWYSVLR